MDQPDPTPSGDVALLIDWESIKRSLQDEDLKPNVTAIRETVEHYGQLVIAWAYADWADPWHRRDPARLHDAGIEPVYVTTKASHRRGSAERLPNSVDVKLTADCIELVHRHPTIQTIVLASGDADFVHAINPVRPYGKRVAVIGVSWSVSSRLIEAADEYIECDKDIIQAQPAGPELSSEDHAGLEKALHAVPEIIASSWYPGRASPKWVRRELVKRLGSFDEHQPGFDQLWPFLQLAETEDLIKLLATEDMIEWVVLPEAEPAAPIEVDNLRSLLRFAHQLEDEYDYVAFNFLVNHMLSAHIVSLTRTQLASMLSDAINDGLFRRSQYRHTDDEGETQDIRTIELNHEHLIVQAALAEDDELAARLSALAENLDSPEHHSQVAECYADLGQWPEALDHLERAIRLAPDRLDLRGLRVVLLGRAGRVKQAIESGRALAEANPSHPLPLWSLARVYHGLGQYRTAIPYYREALKLVPPEEISLRVRYTLAIIRCYLALGSLDRARDLCQQALQWASGHPELQEVCQQLDPSCEQATLQEPLGRESL
jgi:tetratricopeptide (TPR) repeat protein